jgi:hypothetical protein
MHLMTPQQWAEKYFDEGSRPSEVTLRRWLNEGKVPGRKVGGTWYVDEHAWDVSAHAVAPVGQPISIPVAMASNTATRSRRKIRGWEKIVPRLLLRPAY